MLLVRLSCSFSLYAPWETAQVLWYVLRKTGCFSVGTEHFAACEGYYMKVVTSCKLESPPERTALVMWHQMSPDSLSHEFRCGCGWIGARYATVEYGVGILHISWTQKMVGGASICKHPCIFFSPTDRIDNYIIFSLLGVAGIVLMVFITPLSKVSSWGDMEFIFFARAIQWSKIDVILSALQFLAVSVIFMSQPATALINCKP